MRLLRWCMKQLFTLRRPMPQRTKYLTRKRSPHSCFAIQCYKCVEWSTRAKGGASSRARQDTIACIVRMIFFCFNFSLLLCLVSFLPHSAAFFWNSPLFHSWPSSCLHLLHCFHAIFSLIF
jgi:hypothetical protein